MGKLDILSDNVVHRQFPWFKPKIGLRNFALRHLYALPRIDATESEGEPKMCDIAHDTATPRCIFGHMLRFNHLRTNGTRGSGHSCALLKAQSSTFDVLSTPQRTFCTPLLAGGGRQ